MRDVRGVKLELRRMADDRGPTERNYYPSKYTSLKLVPRVVPRYTHDKDLDFLSENRFFSKFRFY